MKTSLLVAFAAAAALSGSTAPAATNLKTAVFAGGCFWSVEHEMAALPGVADVVAGYSGGATAKPTYENHADHLEAVRVTYDPARISYAQLVDGFFHRIDPTDPNGQICDQGPSYRTAVFVSNGAEKAAAEQVRAKVAKELGKPVATKIRNAAPFWKAEAYHQDFARRNPARYAQYRTGCRRDARLKAVWGARYAGHAAAAHTARR
ncbi:peptide-methionine (S)-S-oxide reductase MsrA [Phenylobacterium sp.]|jgi:peptide-methionine (S)-S-oxide reductase|uniref:peptide-methionine (S)-S-oxide reductase MsrA n=1 Tax=Phenylobacterium sp. TaxID=1871053 RepID=UPI002E313601|nr:peptide-methionine (S)-S-oxide reductase MsrA [Phenylobacterium sp.]HEX2559002.1 peptide-methionine (S)-S-oxide reductase MsrA [Phenylobacterium sp.]